MKRYFATLFIFVTFGLQAQNVRVQDLSLVVEKSIRFENNVAKLKVKLWNRSSTTLNYLSMSCAFDKFYVSNSQNITTLEKICDKNIPEIITLEPNESNTVEIEIKSSITEMKEFKIGMLIIQTKELINPNDNFILKNSEVVWSSIIYPKM